MKKSLLGLTLLLAPTFAAVAGTVTFNPTKDSTVTSNGFLGGTGANLGSNSILFSIPKSGFESYPILQFDVSSLAGLTVTGTPTLSLYLSGINGDSSGARTFQIRPITGSWTESTVTWTNLPGISTSVASTSFSGITVGSTIALSLTSGLVQSWIDSPSSNFGFEVREATAPLFDLQFASRETAHQPFLTVTTGSPTPEPGSIFLGLSGIVVGTLVHRRRQKSPTENRN